MDLLEYLSQQIQQSDNLLKRTQYRKDLMKALINSYPTGVPIKPREMSILLGYRPEASSVFTLLNGLLRRGEIARQSIRGTRSYAYTVLKPGNTYDEERATSKVEVTQLKQEDNMEKTYTFEELEALAMKYQFYNFGISMTVAQFLEKLKEV